MMEDYMRKKVHVYVWPGHFTIEQKLAQPCESTKLSFKKERKKKEKDVLRIDTYSKYLE